MRFLGKITHPKDLTTKEYVDTKAQELDDKKVNAEDVEEYTEDEVQELWNQYFGTDSNNQ